MAKKSSFFKDFKNFISKGNILDMAVGVIIGGAFGKIVSSLVADIISPLIALATGGVSLSEQFALISTPDKVPEGLPLPATATEAAKAGFNIMRWGNFIQMIIDFLIIALSIFIFLRIIVKAKAKINAKKDAEAAEKAKAEKEKADAAAKEAAERKLALEEATLKQEKLLEDIRNLLAKK